MTDDQPRATTKPEPVRLPSERFTRGGETVTSEEWERLHDRTYRKDRT